MKLKADCVRAVLLAIEDKPMDEIYTFEDMCAKLPDEDPNDIQYTCIMLKEANYLNVFTETYWGCTVPNIDSIGNLTFAGHQYLEKVRDNTVWGKTKKVAAHAKNFSLEMLGDIAKAITTEMAQEAIKSLLQ